MEVKPKKDIKERPTLTLEAPLSAAQRVEVAIMEWIAKEQMQPGATFPPQAKLAAVLKTSPRVIQQVMTSLVRRGLVDRRPGAGSTLVRIPGSPHAEESIRSRGIRPEEVRLGNVGLVFIDELKELEADDSDTYRTKWISYKAAENALRQTHIREGASLRNQTCQNISELKKFIHKSDIEGLLIQWSHQESSARFAAESRFLLESLGIPVVNLTLSSATNPYLSNLVQPDHIKIGVLAATHLLELGHKRLAMVHSNENRYFEDNRWEGFDWSLRHAAGVSVQRLGFDSPRDLDDAYWEHIGAQAFATWMASPVASRATGVFCVNDNTAIGFIQAARENGVRIPEDLSLLGADDFIGLCAPLGIQLTSIDQQFEEIGKLAAEELARLVAEGRNACGRISRVAPKLILRETTGPAPKLGG